MSALRLLWELRGRGVRVWVEDVQPRYRGPKPVVTPETSARLKAVKEDLVRLLTERCACGRCSEGELPHGPLCYCLSCVAADPEMDKSADTEDAAAKAEADYEAKERLAIQEEDRTSAEIEAFKAAKAGTVGAVETGAHEQDEPRPPWDRPGRWRWVNPENGPEDLAILAAIDRLDREEARETAAGSCYGCGSRDWWRSRHGGHFVCRRCHPPVSGAEATP